MTKTMKWTSLAATLIIILIIPIYTWLEPDRQEQLITDYRIESVVTATDLYAENCAVCHGVTGEGIGENPALNSEALRTMPEVELSKVISRGRYDTLMAAWAAEEGGVLSTNQVDDLVTLVQYGNWEFIEQRVAELGLTPPAVIEYEVTDEMREALAALPNGAALSAGLDIYAQNCAACHNANGSGTQIAPAIDTQELRATSRDEIIEIIRSGVPGTLMASWDTKLPAEQISTVVDLIYRWPEIINSGIELPEPELTNIPSTPEMIAAGSQLYTIACKSCHGTDAFGSRMAPALNNQLFLSQTPDPAIYQIIAGGVPNTLMPAWGSRLTDQDLQALVAYLRSLEDSAPAILPPITTP